MAGKSLLDCRKDNEGKHTYRMLCPVDSKSRVDSLQKGKLLQGCGKACHGWQHISVGRHREQGGSSSGADSAEEEVVPCRDTAVQEAAPDGDKLGELLLSRRQRKTGREQ